MSDSEISDSERRKRKRTKRKTSRKMPEVDGAEVSGNDDERGVVYLSHIPHGFYEPQMRHFFQQFGKVTRLKLWRSKKSGKPRGFAYIEFEYVDVAKIVADTMNNYLMYQKLLKCKFIPNDDLSATAFSNSDRPFIKPYHREKSVKRHNSLLTANTARIVASQKRLVQRERRRLKKMKALGMECDLSGYAEEWEHTKKARAVISEERRVEALRQKEIEQRKQEALRRAKQKAKLLSKKRRIGKKLRRRAEKEKAAAEKAQESAEKKAQEEDTPDSSKKKSPKRKSSDMQDAVVSSSSEVDGQPLKKKGRASAVVSPAPKVSSIVSTTEDEEEKSRSTRKSRKSGHMTLRSEGNVAASPSTKLGLETPRKITATLKSTKATPRSTAKSLTKKGTSFSRVTSETPTKRQQGLHGTSSDSDFQTEAKTPQSGLKPKTSEVVLSTDVDESEDTDGSAKIKKFTGIQLPASEKKEGSKRRSMKHPEISISGDQLLIF